MITLYEMMWIILDIQFFYHYTWYVTDITVTDINFNDSISLINSTFLQLK